ncbi:MAG: acyl-CoA carboxylase subunit beta [Betaproteobacteria bacterium]|nr:acyl-CoA carboxylase subunit beta [Betaproteobacteria bacterium]
MFESMLRPGHPNFESRKQAMLATIEQLRALEARTVQKSASAKSLFDKRGQLLPRERLARLLDPGAPWLELSTMAGFGLDRSELERSVPGGGVITGIGFVSGVRTLINISDAGIDAGAIQHMGREKILRGQQIALQNRLPYLQLIESAGANLLRYQVEGFVEGGRIFANLARLSAAGLPVIARAKAFLAGPPLLKAATGEIANDEELGGAQMHTQVSGLGEYLADDDAQAIGIARNLMQRLGWQGNVHGQANPSARSGWLPPRYPSEELIGIMPADFREPIDMREVIVRLIDDSDFLDFQPDYGPQTLVGHAAIEGYPIGIITNNGPIDTAGSNKATHFIQACCQAQIPLLYLQNTTGYMVGKASEQAGMIKHGSKMIQAVANASVPSITIHCGASFGAGNYGMCGRGFDPRFIFSWPHAKTAVIDNFERQAGAFYTSARLLDDGLIDPRDTRQVLSFVLATCREEAARRLQPIQFGVARP